jgi:hypothetical protein
VSLASEGYARRVTSWVKHDPSTPNLLLNLLHRSTSDHAKGCAYWQNDGGGHRAATMHALREARHHEQAFRHSLRMATLCQITDSDAYEICDPDSNDWYVIPRHFSMWSLNDRIQTFGHAQVVSPDESYREFVDRLFKRWPSDFRHALAGILERHDAGFDPLMLPTLYGCDHMEDSVVVGRRLEAYAGSPHNFIVGTLGGSAEQVETAGKVIDHFYNKPDRVICTSDDDRLLIHVQVLYEGEHSLEDTRDDEDLDTAREIAYIQAMKYFDAFIGRTGNRRPERVNLVDRLQVATMVVDRKYNWELAGVWDCNQLSSLSLRATTLPPMRPDQLSVG